jgi:hypothetical protein
VVTTFEAWTFSLLHSQHNKSSFWISFLISNMWNHKMRQIRCSLMHCTSLKQILNSKENMGQIEYYTGLRYIKIWWDCFVCKNQTNVESHILPLNIWSKSLELYCNNKRKKIEILPGADASYINWGLKAPPNLIIFI